MERARGNEENKVRVDIAVLGGDRAAFNQRQQVALHPLRGGICTAVVAGRHNLVNFINEHDAALLYGGDGLLGDVEVLQQALRLGLLRQRSICWCKQIEEGINKCN